MRSSYCRELWKFRPSSRNVVVANERLVVRPRPGSTDRSPRLRVVQDSMQEQLSDDALAPATGIVNGVRLSLTFWSFVVFVLLLFR
jgi:hypothetical protein